MQARLGRCITADGGYTTSVDRSAKGMEGNGKYLLAVEEVASTIRHKLLYWGERIELNCDFSYTYTWHTSLCMS